MQSLGPTQNALPKAKKTLRVLLKRNASQGSLPTRTKMLWKATTTVGRTPVKPH